METPWRNGNQQFCSVMPGCRVSPLPAPAVLWSDCARGARATEFSHGLGRNLVLELPPDAHAGKGCFAFIGEMAAAERIDCDYLGRIVQMTLLGPDIVEAVLDGRQPLELGFLTLTLSRTTASQSLPGR